METSLADAFSRLKQSFAGQIFDDRLMRTAYANDASVYQEIPFAVACPKSDADIQMLIEFAQETSIGLIPRTAGTSWPGKSWVAVSSWMFRGTSPTSSRSTPRRNGSASNPV